MERFFGREGKSGKLEQSRSPRSGSPHLLTFRRSPPLMSRGSHENPRAQILLPNLGRILPPIRRFFPDCLFNRACYRQKITKSSFAWGSVFLENCRGKKLKEGV